MPRSGSARDKDIGRRIKLRRQEIGVSQTDLADVLDLSFQQVQKYEKGSNRVSAGRLAQIAQHLKVPITFFYEELGGSGGGGSRLVELLDSVYAVRLLKAFHRMKDQRTRKRTVELVEAMAATAEEK